MSECSEVIYSNDYMDYIVSYYGNIDYVLELFKPDCYQLIDNRFAIIHLKWDNSEAANDLVSSLRLPKYYGLLDSSAINAIDVDRIRRQPGLQLYGQGVLVGMVDTGERVIILSSQ